MLLSTSRVHGTLCITTNSLTKIQTKKSRPKNPKTEMTKPESLTTIESKNKIKLKIYKWNIKKIVFIIHLLVKKKDISHI